MSSTITASELRVRLRTLETQQAQQLEHLQTVTKALAIAHQRIADLEQGYAIRYDALEARVAQLEPDVAPYRLRDNSDAF